MRIFVLFSLFSFGASAQGLSNAQTIGGTTAVVGPQQPPEKTEGAPTSVRWEDPGPKALTLRFGSLKPVLGLNIHPADESTAKSYSLVPNTPSRTFVSVSHDWLGVSASWANPTSAQENALYGLSSSEDFQFRIFTRRIAIESVYQRYSGYYLEDGPNVTGVLNNYPQFPDLETIRWGIHATYNFRPDSFSMSASFDQGKQQIRSGWGWLIATGLNYDRFASTETLVPVALAGTYGSFEDVRNGTLYSLYLAGGIGATWVFWRHWFMSGAMLMGVAQEYKSITRLDKILTDMTAATVANIKVSAGYNGKRFIVGFTAHQEQPTYNIDRARMTFSTQETLVFLGTRFFL